MERNLVGRIQTEGVLKGTVRTEEILKGVITAGINLIGQMHKPVGIEKYEGKYVVVPSPEGEELPTADKKMKENVTIKEIPFYEVSNSAGGNTIIIGKEIL